MEATVENRVPIAMRLPKRDVELIQRYASDNGLTKTDAFLHFLHKGMQSECGGATDDRLASIEALLDEILRKVSVSTFVDTAEVCDAIAREAEKFPAIEKAILFGSFARGDAGPQSDIDVRLRIDRAKPFSVYDLARFQKALKRATGREIDVITSDVIKNRNLAAAIEREGVTAYER